MRIDSNRQNTVKAENAPVHFEGRYYATGHLGVCVHENGEIQMQRKNGSEWQFCATTIGPFLESATTGEVLGFGDLSGVPWQPMAPVEHAAPLAIQVAYDTLL